MRQVDFACREADNSIFAVFTETDLRAAHVVARRIAGVLKNTMLASDRKRSGVDTAVTLATSKPTDNVNSLIARVVRQRLPSAKVRTMSSKRALDRRAPTRREFGMDIHRRRLRCTSTSFPTSFVRGASSASAGSRRR